MGFKDSFLEFKGKAKKGEATEEDSKKLQEEYNSLMSKTIRGASNKLIDMLCSYGDLKEAVVGINITPHYIRICQMQHMFDKWNVTHLDSVCVGERFTAEEMLENIDEYVHHIKTLVKKNKIKSKNVSLTVPLSSSIVRLVNIPHMEEDDLKQAASMENFWQNLIQTNENLHEYSINYRLVRKKEDGTMDLLFVASKMDDINLYAEMIRRAGLNPVIVDVRCFALQNALALSAESVSDAYPSAFLEVGPDENHIMIVDNSEIYTYPVAFSNVSATDMVMDNFKNSEMLEMFVHEYASQVRQVIQQHRETYQGDSVKHLYVVSFLPITSSFLNKLSELLQEYFISEFNVLDHVDVPLKLSSRVQGEENLSAWTVTMGTAIRQLNIFDYLKNTKKPQTNNLLPGAKEFVQKERFKIVSSMCMTLASIIILAICGGLYSLVYTKSVALNENLASLSQVEAEHTVTTVEMNRLIGARKKLMSLEKAQAALPSNQLPLLAAYRRINEVIPEGVWLEEVSFMEPSIVKVTGRAIGDQHILNFIMALNEGTAFDKMAIKKMETTKDDSLHSKRVIQVKDFELEGTLGRYAAQNMPRAASGIPYTNTSQETPQTLHFSSMNKMSRYKGIAVTSSVLVNMMTGKTQGIKLMAQALMAGGGK